MINDDTTTTTDDHAAEADRTTIDVRAVRDTAPESFDARVRSFVADYPDARQAQRYAEEGQRTNGATNIRREGARVFFDAPTLDRNGYDLIGDIALSVGHYGGEGTALNGVVVPREM